MKVSCRRTVCLALFMLSVAAGTSFATGDDTEGKPAYPDDALPVPITPQATSYSCGAAALLGTLVYWKAYDGDEADLYGLLETTEKDGTEPIKIAEGARTFDLNAEVKLGMSLDDLRQELAAGHTVILDLQAWRDSDNHLPWSEDWDDGHYVVLTAMDDRFAFVMDPSTKQGYAYLPLKELMERWHDYEDRHGTIERHVQLGIVISGKRPLTHFPATLNRMQ